MQDYKQDSWKLEQFGELAGMKDQLLFGGMCVAGRRWSGGATDSNNENSDIDCGGGEADGKMDFSELDALNSEMDREMETLMSQLGLVKGQMASLDDHRKKLMAELDEFDEEFEKDDTFMERAGQDPLDSGGFAQAHIEKLGKCLNNIQGEDAKGE